MSWTHIILRYLSFSYNVVETRISILLHFEGTYLHRRIRRSAVSNRNIWQHSGILHRTLEMTLGSARRSAYVFDLIVQTCKTKQKLDSTFLVRADGNIKPWIPKCIVWTEFDCDRTRWFSTVSQNFVVHVSAEKLTTLLEPYAIVIHFSTIQICVDAIYFFFTFYFYNPSEHFNTPVFINTFDPLLCV